MDARGSRDVRVQSVSTSLTQIWFARRQYLLKRDQRWLAVIVVLISFSTLGAGLAAAGSIATNVYLIQAHNFWFEYLWLAGNLVGDIMVTVPVAFTLHDTRSTFPSTHHMMTRIIIWVVATGMLTSAVALLVLVMYVAKTSSLLFVPFARFLASLYANSLLAFLNRRTLWGQESVDSDGLRWSASVPNSNGNPASSIPMSPIHHQPMPSSDWQPPNTTTNHTSGTPQHRNSLRQPTSSSDSVIDIS